MPDQAEHVVLLPPGCDDTWWSVMKEYVVHFQVKVSQPESDCDGVNLVQKAITVLDVPGGWEGDFVACLEDRFPGVELDVIQVSDPQLLGALLAERVATQDRFGESQVLALAWPTDAQATIQQRFGASPWLYRQWGGLPGHEGIDFATTQDAPVFACADG
ncbi:MAG: M23 family metallopeptidase, partial [Anaerolineae bacterium]|nr:M23 family metallopeptidase [Anaerolineae bacterium]